MLRARGLKVWLDEWELVPGRPWQEALEEVIETTGAAAVLVGKDGLGPWQDKEMRGCLAEFVARDLPVIPVLLPGAPEKPMLPIFLKRFTWVDLRSGLNEEEGVDRLQWGITGEKPDRSKPMLVHATTSEAAVASHQREVVQGGQRRPRVMVECFKFIAREDESGEEYYVEALRVINLGEAPAVSIHLDFPEFLGWAVRLRKKPPSRF
ncbi:MAG TPA: transcriptional regulator [Acidobacteria bacterium]|nr:transcriptional regulator [Acidobacteriota bacterium]